jgi:Glycerol-3-phosphate dehydrogenase
MKKVNVLGAGAWGTALACQAHAAGNHVTLWAYLEAEQQEIVTQRENRSKLPGVKVPEAIEVTTDLAAATQADILLLVTPAQAIRGFLQRLKPYLKPETVVVFCSKGIEIATGALMTDLCAAEIPGHPIAVLSGPNFAKEIGAGKPGAATLGCADLTQAQQLAQQLSSPTFRIYPTDDVMGVQIGGALKNVIAIAAGIVTGAQLGENARAALITRGLQEMANFGELRGARRETFMGLSGMGDLVLCCLSTTSRNMNFGYQIGLGKSVEELLSEGQILTEGVHTAKAIMHLTEQQPLDMPICAAVYRILYQGAKIEQEMIKLLDRPQKFEVGTQTNLNC